MAVVVTSWSGTSPSTRNKLVDKVLRPFGISAGNDDEVAQIALEMLDECVSDLNTSMFEFNKVRDTSVALTASQGYVTLSTTFYRESLAFLVHTTDGPYSPLTYLPWVQFQRWYNDTATSGQPEVYSVFNFEGDQRLSIYPIPDTDTATNCTLTVEYYRRIPLISSTGAGSSLDVPVEIENALVYGGQKRMALHLGQQSFYDRYENLERIATDRLKRVDKLHPDERKFFVLATDAYRRNHRSRIHGYIKY